MLKYKDWESGFQILLANGYQAVSLMKCGHFCADETLRFTANTPGLCCQCAGVPRCPRVCAAGDQHV
jgi:hypothetical protein